MPSSARSCGDQPGVEIGRFRRRFLRIRIDCAEARGGGTLAPVGRREPRHAAAFLIDQHGRARIADRLAQGRDQRAHLSAVVRCCGRTG